MDSEDDRNVLEEAEQGKDTVLSESQVMVLSDDVLGIVCNRVDISDLSNGKSLPKEIM